MLDVDCGTGDLANQLYMYGVHVTEIDHSSNMIALAKRKYPYINFEVGDANHLRFEPLFDAMFSNATLD